MHSFFQINIFLLKTSSQNQSSYFCICNFDLTKQQNLRLEYPLHLNSLTKNKEKNNHYMEKKNPSEWTLKTVSIGNTFSNINKKHSTYSKPVNLLLYENITVLHNKLEILIINNNNPFWKLIIAYFGKLIMK